MDAAVSREPRAGPGRHSTAPGEQPIAGGGGHGRVDHHQRDRRLLRASAAGLDRLRPSRRLQRGRLRLAELQRRDADRHPQSRGRPAGREDVHGDAERRRRSRRQSAQPTRSCGRSRPTPASRRRSSSAGSSSRPSSSSPPTAGSSWPRRAGSSRSSPACPQRRPRSSPICEHACTTTAPAGCWGWPSTPASRPCPTSTCSTRTTLPSAARHRRGATAARRRTPSSAWSADASRACRRAAT